MGGPARLGVDVGGTQTDRVLLNVADGTIEIEKVSSTPANPAIGSRCKSTFTKGVDIFQA